MEQQEQRLIHEPSSSRSAYCSTLEELDSASYSVYTSAAVENAEESTSSRLWTSIDYTSDSDDEGYVRVHPGTDVPNLSVESFKLLEKIGEGGQGIIYNAQFSDVVRGMHNHAVVAKLYKGRGCGQWPEDVFALHRLNPYICAFYGYCLQGESFYLIMAKCDFSLREVLDHLMKDEVERKLMPDITALLLIVQIALGMRFLHEKNILHRDLKADNVFVNLFQNANMHARIGDFDVASKVVGTLFWRAPEVLQALKDGKRPVFTPEADVYSYAMTCYEILTGRVPMEGVGASKYDVILLQGKRPMLPSNLNPKMKDLISRCWHQDPEARPTFKEIVIELKELSRELITGSEDLSRDIDGIFSYGSSSVDNGGASPEASLLELKTLVQSLLVKYGEEDFVRAFMEMIADLEQYQSEFGFRSFEEHPLLPLPEWIAREKLRDKARWSEKVFQRLRAHIGEGHRINHLLTSITLAIDKNNSSCDIQSEVAEMLNLDNSSDVKVWVELLSEYMTWLEECSARVLPEFAHLMCTQWRQRARGWNQACDLCKMNDRSPVELNAENRSFVSHLYVTSSLTSMLSSLGERIRRLL